MNRTDELLEKYFAGITSLQEEKELKAYFKSGCVADEHRKYVPLFQAFEMEKTVVAPDLEHKTNRSSSLFKRRWTIIVSGAAAACLLLFFTARYQQYSSENYMIVRGKRINNPEMARNFANAKLEKSLDIINRSLSSQRNNEMVREKLQEIEQEIKLKNNPLTHR